MQRKLAYFAVGALLMIPALGRADDSIVDKAEDVLHGIHQGFKDAAHDVKQAVVGHDVEVSLGERHMEMPTSVEAGDVTFTVTNDGSEDRGFKITGPGLERSFTVPLPPGQSEKITVNLEPGVYQVEAAAQEDPTKQLTVQLTALAN
jgi:iron uptake system EfeUOB component EfeO/EfeM